MYNLIDYSKNYLKISGTLWKYYKVVSIDPITNSESFKYKTNIKAKRASDGNTKEVEFSVPLKHLSKFWKILDMELINSKLFLNLTWSENCAITEKKKRCWS